MRAQCCNVGGKKKKKKAKKVAYAHTVCPEIILDSEVGILHKSILEDSIISCMYTRRFMEGTNYLMKKQWIRWARFFSTHADRSVSGWRYHCGPVRVESSRSGFLGCRVRYGTCTGTCTSLPALIDYVQRQAQRIKPMRSWSWEINSAWPVPVWGRSLSVCIQTFWGLSDSSTYDAYIWPVGCWMTHSFGSQNLNK